jgi:hypothetical protein
MIGRIERVEDFPDELDDDLDDPDLPSSSSSFKEDPQPTVVDPPSAASSSSSSSHRIRRASSSASMPRPSPPPIPRSSSHPYPSRSLSNSTQDLVTTCLAFLNTLQDESPWISQRLSHTYGYGVYGPYGAWFESDHNGAPVLRNRPASPSPSSAPSTSISDSVSDPSTAVEPFDASGFSFWVASLLPIDESEKAKLLPVRSVKMRLQMCVWWIEGFRRQWWFSNGCIVM